MPQVPFTAIDHVQLAMPRGREDEARAFFIGGFGMEEIAKPTELAARGGCWFRSGTVDVHLGVQDDFRPASKAHPAFVCANYHVLIERLQALGVSVRADDFKPAGNARCHVLDPFGNRIELIESQARTHPNRLLEAF